MRCFTIYFIFTSYYLQYKSLIFFSIFSINNQLSHRCITWILANSVKLYYRSLFYEFFVEINFPFFFGGGHIFSHLILFPIFFFKCELKVRNRLLCLLTLNFHNYMYDTSITNYKFKHTCVYIFILAPD